MLTADNKVLCLYHADCSDGMAAAWVVRKALGKDNVEFIAVKYNQPPPNVTGRDVIIVDFSYKYEVLRTMGDVARTILILDHHKTAQAELASLLSPPSWERWNLILTYNIPPASPRTNKKQLPWVVAQFDMARSGAMMAWDYFFPGKSAPLLLSYIEDRDLWRLSPERQGRDDVHRAVSSYPQDFDVWDTLMDSGSEGGDIGRFRTDGEAIGRKQELDIKKIIAETKRTMVIGNYKVEVVNIPHMLASDAGHVMASGVPFAASYYDTATARIFSLRSAPDGVDVEVIARSYKGGGHPHAAGFAAPCGWEGEG